MHHDWSATDRILEAGPVQNGRFDLVQIGQVFMKKFISERIPKGSFGGCQVQRLWAAISKAIALHGR